MDCVCLLRMPLSPLPRFLSNTAYFIQNSERNPFYREDSSVSSKTHFASSFSVFATLCMHFFYLLSIWDDNYRFTYLSPSLACERSEGRARPSLISEALVPGSWSEPSKYLMNGEGMNAVIQPCHSSCFRHPSISALLRGKGPFQSPRTLAELQVWALLL